MEKAKNQYAANKTLAAIGDAESRELGSVMRPGILPRPPF